MRKVVYLKDKREIEIDIWNNKQLETYISKEKRPSSRRGMGIHYEGFEFFGPRMISNRKSSEMPYPGNSSLTKMEIQYKISGINQDFDRAIVALDRGEIIGIESFMWVKSEKSFWKYYPRFVDVRKDWKHNGVATALIQRLNEPCFMWGKMMVGSGNSYSPEGKKYFKKLIERKLRTDKFAIISNHLTKPVLKPGIYKSPIDKLF